MAKSPVIVGDPVSSQRTHCPHPCGALCAHAQSPQTGALSKITAVALEHLSLRVGVLVTRLDKKSVTKKPMKWCYVFTIPYYH